MTKSKILPENEGSYICVICFNSTSKKKIFKCKNSKCSDGIICYHCIEQYNEYGYSEKCPLCRNNSDAFVVKKINIFPDIKKLQFNTSRDDSCNFLFVFKIIVYSLLYFIVNTGVGLIVCIILGIRPNNSHIFVWFLIGFLVIFTGYISAGFCSAIFSSNRR